MTDSGACNGNVIANVVPSPTVLSTERRPPRTPETMLCTMCKPRPLPTLPNLVVKNGSKNPWQIFSRNAPAVVTHTQLHLTALANESRFEFDRTLCHLIETMQHGVIDEIG